MTKPKSTPSKRFYLVLGLLIVGISAGLWFGRHLTPPTGDTRQLLEATRDAVLSYADEKNAVPPDLGALVAGGYLEGIPENRSGHPLVYSHLGGGRCEIKSLGPDGKEGGFMFKGDQSITFSVELD